MLEKAILRTLVYRDLFDYPLTAEEIHRFLIGQRSSPKAVEEALQGMVIEGKIQSSLRSNSFSSKIQSSLRSNSFSSKIQSSLRSNSFSSKIQSSLRSDSLSRPRSKVQERDDYYFLPGREEIVGLRQKREVISGEKFKKAARYAGLLRPIPWVKAVFATGALAVENADEESDLDLLVFVTPRRLWLTRSLVFLIFGLLGVKRSPGGMQTADKVCPNMFLSLTALAAPSDEQNLYTAHEAVQARPIWERGCVHQRFLAENSWIEEFLPNCKSPSGPEGNQPKSGLVFLDWLEVLAYKLQLKYMVRRRTREVVTPERILFHPIDRAAKILPKFEERLARLALAIDKAL